MKPVQFIKLSDEIMDLDALLKSNVKTVPQEKVAGLKKTPKSMVSANTDKSKVNKL